jgi:hypothetical protein
MNLVGMLLPFVVVILLLLVLSRLIVREAGAGRLAEELSGGTLQFAPNPSAYWAVYLFIASLAYLVIEGVLGIIETGNGWIPAVLCTGFILLLLSSFPGSIVADNKGLTQSYWLSGRRNIAWDDVWAVSVEEKNGRVTVKSKRSGAKIVHTRQLPDRARLLAELQTHCPDRMPGARRVVSAPVAS